MSKQENRGGASTVGAAEAVLEGAVKDRVEHYARWLEQCGYMPHSIHCHRLYLPWFLNWADKERLSIAEMKRDTAERFAHSEASQGPWRLEGSRCAPTISVARSFINFLIVEGIISDDPTDNNFVPEMLVAFDKWMLEHRGVKKSTLGVYRPILLKMVAVLGEEPENYSARDLRDFILGQAMKWGRKHAKTFVTATKMFLKFLSATGKVSPDLVDALPTIAQWSLSSLPRHLSPSDLERVVEVSSLDNVSEQGVRNHVVVLLLARLGLRSIEVAELKMEDIDWITGRLVVFGKGRREAWLPLSQEIGEALMNYITKFRPHVDSERIFITLTAPRRAMSRGACKHIAKRAVKRAGVTAPHYGAHLLRHSAATSMLAKGLSLETISALLRHHSISTTEIYAKVDQKLLASVAQPWPEVAPC